MRVLHFIHVYIHMHMIHIHTHVRTHIPHGHMHTRTHIRTFHTDTCTHVHIHTYAHMHTHTHTRTHTHTCHTDLRASTSLLARRMTGLAAFLQAHTRGGGAWIYTGRVIAGIYTGRGSAILTLHPHAPPSHSTTTHHHHTPPPRTTITIHHHAPLLSPMLQHRVARGDFSLKKYLK